MGQYHKYFNDLTPAQLERLAILGEELAEAAQIVGKILRHGWFSYSPFNPEVNNRQLLEKELGHVMHSVDRLAKAEEVNLGAVNAHSKVKAESIKRYLHHQNGEDGVITIHPPIPFDKAKIYRGDEHRFGPVRTTVPSEQLPLALIGQPAETHEQWLKRVFGSTTPTYRVCERCGRSDVYLASLGVVEGSKCQ